MSFAHLHLHTDSSLLDGMIMSDRLVERVKKLGQPAVAITDHGWIAGAVKLVQAATKAEIKPIIGSELYVTLAGPMTEPSKKSGDAYHLTVLAMNREGYRNLTHLTTKAHVRGFSYKPRVDREALAEHSAGLIVLSGCWGAEIPETIRREVKQTGKIGKQTKQVLDWYVKTFGDRFYLEVMSHGATAGISHVRDEDKTTGEVLMDEWDLNAILVEISKKRGIPLVATNDAHYLEREDGPAHDALLCLGMGAYVTKEDRMRFPGAEEQAWEFYVKGAVEMKEAGAGLDWWVDACDMTGEVAARVEDGVLQLKQNVMPTFDIPEDEKLALRVWMEAGILI